MKSIVVFFTLILSCFSYASQGKIYVAYPENTKSYKKIAESIKEKLKNNNTIVNADFSVETGTLTEAKNTPRDENTLIIKVGEKGVDTTKDNGPVIHTFSTLKKHEKTSIEDPKNFASIVLDQPLQLLVDTASKAVKNNYKNKIIISISESNRSALKQIENLTPPKNGEVIVVKIKDGEIAAKVIEQHLFNAAALIAIRDSQVWSRKNAAWMLRQAYNYQVPVIGYSQAFLKAGAMISIYSSNDDIINQTINSVEKWTKTGTLDGKQAIHPKHTLEINRNIATALKFNPEILKKIKGDK
jgi:ABC-type uncharacterized transport system substrate-binding protein